MQKSDIFKSENCVDQREVKSPSGQYTLVINSFKTKDGCWNYTQGEVYKTDDWENTENPNRLITLLEEPIAKIQRNYSHFPYLFIEDHPNGHDYLICGENYQGQTVIELDTGERKDYLSKDAKKGHGFCWSKYRFNRRFKILTVEGCVWACPYEFRFFDFSDPMNGWPEFQTEKPIYADTEGIRQPILRRNGKIYCFESEYIEADDCYKYYDENDNLIKKPPIASVKIFNINGIFLDLEKELVSKKEQEKRRKNKEANDKFNAWWKNFKETDPLYLKFIERLKEPEFESAEKHDWIGQTHERWCPDFDKNEKRTGKNIIWKDDIKVKLEWAVDTGPIKIEVYQKKTEDIVRFFKDHTVESMNEAFDYAKSFI